MRQSISRLILLAGLFCLAALQGCATKIKASASWNPPPREALSVYGQIALLPAVFRAGYKGDTSGLAKINDNLRKDLAHSLQSWNAQPANGRSLSIEPVVEEMEFTHGATRVLFGPLAGSSGVLLKLTLRDESGAVVANPEFFQRADAWAAGFIFGVHDNLMLMRVANLASQYIMANHAAARGGPTGADARSIGRK